MNKFKKHCPKCGYELEIDIDKRFKYKTYWCRGRCADFWNS